MMGESELEAQVNDQLRRAVSRIQPEPPLTPRERLKVIRRDEVRLFGVDGNDGYFRLCVSRDADPEAILWEYCGASRPALNKSLDDEIRRKGETTPTRAKATASLPKGQATDADARVGQNAVPGEAGTGLPRGPSRNADPGTATHAGGEASNRVPQGQATAVSPPAPSEEIQQGRLRAMHAAAAVRSSAHPEFEEVRVNGRSMLDCTTEEVGAWAERTGRNLALAKALCSLIADPRKPIRSQITEAIMAEALRIAGGLSC
jgi:hypothetical protein